jgi:hypothetical protein
VQEYTRRKTRRRPCPQGACDLDMLREEKHQRKRRVCEALQFRRITERLSCLATRRNRGGIRSLRKRIVEKNARARAIERSGNSWKSPELEHRRPKPKTGEKEGRGLGVGWKETDAGRRGREGQCSCEGTLLHRGNPAGKASDKPRGGPELSGEEGRLLLLPDKWSFEDKGIVCCWFNRPEIVLSQRKKVVSLMLRKHLINLAEVVTERGSLRICRRPEEHREVSLVISWLGTGVARVLRVNASEPMVGWKGEHPQSVGWLQLVIDKYFICPVYLK